MLKLNKIHCMDCLEGLKQLDKESISCVMTSPPYWALRDYGKEIEKIWDGNKDCKHEWESKITKRPNSSGGKGHLQDANKGSFVADYNKRETKSDFCSKCNAWKGQLGLEPTFDLYIKHLCDIFDEVKRILRKDGTCWVNIGDTYGTKSGSGFANDNLNPLTKEEIADGTGIYEANKLRGSSPEMHKNLCNIPARFSIEMQKRRGFIIKDENDRAWLAGIIEGEGCITIHKRDEKFRKNATYGVFLSIHNTNKEIIDRVVKLSGMDGNIQITDGDDRNHKLFRWNAMSDNGKKILREVYPYLVSKRDQTRCALFCPSSGTDAEECWQNIKKMHNYEQSSRSYPEPEVGGIDPWILRNVIVWKKPNCMPSSVKDRFTIDFEYLFFFVKNKKYWFETQYEPIKSESTIERYKYNFSGNKLNVDRELIGQPEGKKQLVPYSVQPRDKDFIEYRNLPDLKEFSIYINEARKWKKLTIEEVESKHNTQAPHHWFNGESFPSAEDYLWLKELLSFGDFYNKQMTEILIKSSEKTLALINTELDQYSRNKRAVWTITTQPFKEAHFATFPEELVETPIKAGCPEFICSKCGKAREKIYLKIGTKPINQIGGIKQAGGDNPTYSGNTETPIWKENGLSDCKCNAEFSKGIVLDPFAGAGTTCLVARKKSRNFIGFELNPKYVKIANERLKPYMEQQKLTEIRDQNAV